MLKIARYAGQGFRIGGALVKVLKIGSNRVELAIEAPREISVQRLGFLEIESLPNRGSNEDGQRTPQ